MTTPDARRGSRSGSQKRAFGTGSIHRDRHYWVARVSLAGGRRVTRKVWTEEQAEVALLELRREYAGQLGYYYQRPPKPVRFGEAPSLPRAGVTRRVRFQVLDRDGYRCVYCGATPKQSQLHVDHVVPVSKGGTDHPSNLATACIDCNLGKAAMDLSA